MECPQKRVLEFCQKFECPILEHPAFPSSDVVKLKVDLIDEELKELRIAVHAGDMVEVADALGDLIYVVYGAALAFGIDMEIVEKEIHRSNMTKLGEDGKPVKNPSTGKVMKGPNFDLPNLSDVLTRMKPVAMQHDPLASFTRENVSQTVRQHGPDSL